MRDILDALVAAGTLALAGVTAWLAFDPVMRRRKRIDHESMPSLLACLFAT